MKPTAVSSTQTLPRNIFNSSIPKILKPLNEIISKRTLSGSEGFNIWDEEGYGVSGHSWHPWINNSVDDNYMGIEISCYIDTRPIQGLPNLRFNLQGLALKVSMAGLNKEFLAPFDKDGTAKLEMLPSGAYSLEVVSLTSSKLQNSKQLLVVK